MVVECGAQWVINSKQRAARLSGDLSEMAQVVIGESFAIRSAVYECPSYRGCKGCDYPNKNGRSVREYCLAVHVGDIEGAQRLIDSWRASEN